MRKNNNIFKSFILLFFSLSFFLVSCGGGESLSNIEDNVYLDNPSNKNNNTSDNNNSNNSSNNQDNDTSESSNTTTSDNTTNSSENNNTSNTSNGNNNTSEDNYVLPSVVFYLPYSAGSDIYVVDPENPTQKTKLTNGSTGSKDVILKASVNTQDLSYKDLYIDSVIYIQNGKIYKIKMNKENFTSTAVQISTITDACSMWKEFEDVKNGVAYFQISTAGSDGKCDTLDDDDVFINTNMSSADLPTRGLNYGMTYVVSEILDADLFSINGFLVLRQGADLQKCDTRLSNCTTILSRINGFYKIGKKPGSREFYACIKTNPNGTYNSSGNYYVYKFDGNSIYNTNISCDRNMLYFGSIQYDSTGIYIAYNNVLYKFNFNTYRTEPLYINNNASSLSIITATAERIILVDDTNKMLIVSKQDGSLIKTFDLNTADYEPIISTHDKFFFTKFYPLAACYIDDNSTDEVCLNDLYWVSLTVGQDGKFYPEKDGYYIYNHIDRLIAINPYNKEIYSLDANLPDLNNKILIGTIPDGYVSLESYRSHGIGRYLLARLYNSNNKIDLFFIDVYRSNSLQQITNTPNLDELPLVPLL